MDRDCLIAECVVNKEIFAFSTVHLESLDTAAVRKKQLQMISNQLKNYKYVIFTGDFNFDSEINFSDHLNIAKEKKLKSQEQLVQSAEQYQTPEQIRRMSQTSQLENDNLREFFSDYIDVWPELHWSTPDDKGYTFDSESNMMLKDYERMRYDRVLFKHNSKWQPVSIELLGVNKLKSVGDAVDPSTGKQVVVYPSDHFGLVMKVQCSE